MHRSHVRTGVTPQLTRSAGAVGEAFARPIVSEGGSWSLSFPPKTTKKRNRGDIWGELLNFGTDVQLAPLSSVEVVCATMADLNTVVPHTEVGEPLFLLVSTDKVPAAVKAFDTQVPEHADFFGRGENVSWEELERKEDETSTRRIAAIASLLRGALGAPGSQRCRRCGERPPAAQRPRSLRHTLGGELGLRHARRRCNRQRGLRLRHGSRACQEQTVSVLLLPDLSRDSRRLLAAARCRVHGAPRGRAS